MREFNKQLKKRNPRILNFRIYRGGRKNLFFKFSRPETRVVFSLSRMVASGHTATNTPDLFRTPKLTVAGPGQYWGGDRLGSPLGAAGFLNFSPQGVRNVTTGIVFCGN